MTRKISIDPLLVLLGLGALLRAAQYLNNFSMWADESWLALAVSGRSVMDIVLNRNLGNNCVLPPCFLLIIKGVRQVFGGGEYALRLFPFLCGIFSLGLFRELGKKYFRRPAQTAACFLFAFSPPLIFYSAELKQYSSDAAVALLLYVVCVPALKDPLKFRRAAGLSVLGILCSFISHTAVFILAGIAVAGLAEFLREKKKSAFAGNMTVYLIWMAGFAVIYLFYFRVMFESKAFGYMEEGLLSLRNPGLSAFRALSVFRSPAGMSFPVAGLAVFILGFWSLLRRDEGLAIRLTAPLALVLIASFCGEYPFQGRFLVFLLPGIFFVLAEAFGFFWQKGRAGRIAAVILLAVLSGRSTADAVRHLFAPRGVSQTRQVMTALKDRQRPGDVIYMNSEAQYAYCYYTQALGYSFTPRIVGIINNQLNEKDGEPFIYLYHYGRGFDSRLYRSGRMTPGVVNPARHALSYLEGRGRVWILCAQMNPDAEKFFLRQAEKQGGRVSVVKKMNAALYLYDFRGPEARRGQRTP